MSFRLSTSDKAILSASAHPQTGGIATLMQWYFDVVPLEWQFAFGHASQKRIAALAGIRSGKTFGVAERACYKCMTIPYYKFLNASISTDQAAVMYWLVRGWFESSPKASKWVDEYVKRPFPVIKLVNGSMMDFRSVGFQAELLRTMEWDWVNVDEAGWVNDYFTIQVLMGRTLGTRVDGKPREGVLSVTTSPTDAQWLRDLVEKGIPPTHRHLTLRASIRDNIHLDKEAVEEMYDDYDPELAAVELDGFLPEFAASLFPSHIVNRVIDPYMNELLDNLVEQEEDGAVKFFDPKLGLTRWEMPYDPHGHYILSADLGTANVPKRGSSALGVLNVAVEPNELVAWQWVSGGGSWKPGLEAFKYLDKKYSPALKAIDSTGAQGVLVDVLSDSGIDAEGLKMNLVKDAMITEAQLDFQGRKFKMPFITAIVKQVSTYKLPDKKIVQDAAMMLFQLLHLTRFATVKGQKRWTKKRLMQGHGRARARRTTGRRR